MVDPVAPAVEYPAWLREPAKLVGWLVAGTLVGVGAIVEILNEVGGVLPAKWQDEIRAVLSVAATITLIATRIQALLTRAKVWAPATLDANAARLHAGQGIGTPGA